ncbi:response regulator receiver domain protein [Campylobacter rectus RM3267]|uniref:Two-component system response regulator n=2 Tax=Campylobacter rectus TaxID=203 RepID=A0A6G5QKC9_CAMRE|nr:response regulator transcription factor [Campylobacter rectus]EEF14779.1 response regulator receiver domain protein [Campylobacter rectus RM3267]QCD46062.1 two-component system response regulator [Campylobacter rectus]UEB46776.1 response regulator transcription factor [Campylobacter rectus]
MKNFKELTLLLVEDEDSIRESMQEVFSGMFQKVISASNGDEGLKKFKKFSPDIVIADIMMPIMDGLEMSKQIKEVSKNTPVIILSAYSEKERLLKAIDVGIDKYVIKPIDMDELFVVLEQIVKTKIIGADIIEISGGYSFNQTKKVLVKNGVEIALTKKELAFISLLVKRIGTLVLTEEIRNVVWFGEKVNDPAVRTFIKRIRDKVGAGLIKNSPGLGYKIELKK